MELERKLGSPQRADAHRRSLRLKQEAGANVSIPPFAIGRKATLFVGLYQGRPSMGFPVRLLVLDRGLLESIAWLMKPWLLCLGDSHHYYLAIGVGEGRGGHLGDSEMWTAAHGMTVVGMGRGR